MARRRIVIDGKMFWESFNTSSKPIARKRAKRFREKNGCLARVLKETNPHTKWKWTVWTSGCKK